ncbi:MAG: dethiobiotin synthase [Pseudoflavonifractor sp.]|nr:dethiobiotin synthase [Alloprevotella sp.]MCM1117146.1 dethiobiotin synthase [Pseudoflavonifractor sp.]
MPTSHANTEPLLPQAPNRLFVSGIDTDAGKTFCTAWLAMRLAKEQGLSVVTQKFVQTGCEDMSEDIVAHRRIQGIELMDVDLDHTTAPVIFSYPASAQLAARIDGCEIDLDAIDRASDTLVARFDSVLIEGAGGLMVPLTDSFLTIDYILSRRLPVALVTNGVLGSINHTILSLEALMSRNIPVWAILYNTHFDTDPMIAADTRGFIERYVASRLPSTPVIDVPSLPLTE